jgi:hypothetical protein
VPNRRLTSELAGLRRLWSADDRERVGDIRRSIAAETDLLSDPGSDPEEFWKLADTQARDVRITWSPGSADGHFDVALIATDRSRGAPSPQPATNAAPAAYRGRLATDPLAAAFMQQLGLELSALLSDRLAEAQLPAAVLAVNELPSGAAATPPRPAAYVRPESDGRAGARRMAQG